MGIGRRIIRGIGAAWLAAVLCLSLATPGLALAPLPPGDQVNNDPAAGIDPAVSVAGQDPANADVVGGALTAGKPAVPWAIFAQQESGGAHDQVFSRSFANGAWTTRGAGTVNGDSSFRGSLNFNQGQDGETPAIDFAGAGRTVPWATWYEETPGPPSTFGNNNIFVSRFDNTSDANEGKWIFSGQDRGPDVNGVPVPSLNIDPQQSAQNPVVAGGSTSNPGSPGPWVTWQETTSAPTAGADEIFVTRSLGPGEINCDGVTPTGVTVAGHVSSIGGFCWQETGLPRVGPGGADPSLNVDPHRNGLQPDIAFAGAQDAVPWVVWFERGTTPGPGLRTNDMVFAAKANTNGAADGGLQWVAVGSQASGTLDTTGGYGTCAASAVSEGNCSLNSDPTANAADPRVAAGTMVSTGPAVPWVTWDESVNGVTQVFVSRLVGTGAGAHFQIANHGAPVSTGANTAERPDITFSAHTPYISWRQDVGGGIDRAFVGHFINAADPTFVLDDTGSPLTSSTQVDVREPLSSTCAANPFNQDGSACQGSALGTPFALFTSGPVTHGLFAGAYQPGTPVTEAPSAVTSSSATLMASVNPQGSSVTAAFQYGATTAYGQQSPAQTFGADNSADAFTAPLSGLPAGTTLHYRAVASTDFGTVVGADQTVTTATDVTPPTPLAPPPPPQGVASAGRTTVKGSIATTRITCRGTTPCVIALTLTVHETFLGRRLTAVTARRKLKRSHKQLVIGTTNATIKAGQSELMRVGLNRAGRRLLAARRHFTATLTVTQRIAQTKKVMATHKVKFTAPKRRRRR